MEVEKLVVYTIPFAGIACATIPLLSPAKKPFVAFVSILLSSIITSLLAINALWGNAVEATVIGTGVFESVRVSIDPLSAWFILIINLTCVNGTLYGIGYLKPYQDQRNNLSLHWSLLVVFHLSMLWVCFLQHVVAFLVAWEIMSISSFLLILFDHSRMSVKAGINYLVQMHIGVACITVAFVWIALSAGSYDFRAMTSFFSKSNSYWAFVLLFIGFGTKAGFVPLHTWLPHAHPAAPSHISGIMSGVIVKVGIYGIIRMITFLNSGFVIIGEIVLLLSVVTAVYGILSAAIHRDFKRMLAFCTIENIGIIGMGIGIGLIGKGLHNYEIVFLGFSAALLHALNHSLYKSLLFFASGNVYQLTHTRNIEHLGGLIKVMPFTAFFFLIGSLAIGGLPPFNGFISKFLLYSSLVEGIGMENFQLNVIVIGCIAGLAIAGGISILTFTKSFGVMFLGTPRSKSKHQVNETLSYSYIPLFAISLLMLLIGIFPSVILPSVYHVVLAVDPQLPAPVNFLSFSADLTKAGMSSALLIVLITSVYFIRSRAGRSRDARFTATWGCGYASPNSKMQYTGKSFSKTFAKLLAFVTGEQKKYTEIEPNNVFPTNRSYQSNYPEYFEKNIIDQVTNQLLHFLNRFRFIHNGQVQMYVLYGFLFMMGLIIATLLNFI